MSYSSVKLYRVNSNNERPVVVYYRNQTILRHPTSVVVKQKDFNTKEAKVKSTDSDFTQKNEIIGRVHGIVEDIINSYVLEFGFKPESGFVKKQIILKSTEIKIKSNAELTDYYYEFLLDKKVFFNNPDRSKSSIKDYKSTYNALIDYKAVVKSIPINSLDSFDWLEQFNQFLAKDRPIIMNHKFSSKKQDSKTRHKRFACLKNFGKWLSTKNIVKTVEILNGFSIRVHNNDHYALTLEEIKQLQETQFEKESHQKAIDLFVFACHTGLRISDVKQVKKSMIKEKSDTQFIIFNNQKTKERAEVPLSKMALKILEKYNYKLNLYSEQIINKNIHQALEKLKIFNEFYIYGKNNEDAPKYELITFHTARRSFITTLVNSNISLNAVMKMTGHRKISTLQGYINPNYDLIKDNIRIFNDL